MYDFIFGKLYPLISDFALLVFLFDIIIVVPISFFKKFKKFSGKTIFYSSYVFGLQLWLSGLMLTLQTWGIVAAIIGILLVGVGVIPMGMLATLIDKRWDYFIELLLQVVIILGSRIFGAYLLEKSTFYSHS